jgi:hypothetical protein
VVVVTAVSSGTELAATVGELTAAVRLVGGAGLPATIVPGVRVAIAGTVDRADGAQLLAVTVGAGDIRLAG